MFSKGRHRGGGSNTDQLIKLVVIAALGYTAWFFGPAMLVRQRMGPAIDDAVLRRRTGTDDQAMHYLRQLTIDKGMDRYVDVERDCIISHRAQRWTIECRWVVSVDHPLGGPTDLKFQVDQTGALLHQSGY